MRINIDKTNNGIMISYDDIISELSNTKIQNVNEFFSMSELYKTTDFSNLENLINSYDYEIKVILFDNNENGIVYNIIVVEHNKDNLSLVEVNQRFDNIGENSIIDEINKLIPNFKNLAEEKFLNKLGYFKNDSGDFTIKLEWLKTQKIQEIYRKIERVKNLTIIYNNYKFKNLDITKYLLSEKVGREFVVFNLSTTSFEVKMFTETELQEIETMINNKVSSVYDEMIIKVKEIMSASTKDEIEAIDLSCETSFIS